jgi:UDP-N-acetyl-D-glucosamine dehydrogenase
VNIALVNELKFVFERMGIDIWEVVEAAATKPFGFQPFYPGPGLGGHCIPVDPFYLSWKAREFDIPTRFIELAGEVNVGMPRCVVDRLQEALNDRGQALRDARVLVMGVSYKENVDDIRESPALKIIDLLRGRGAVVSYSDPYVPALGVTRDHTINLVSLTLAEGVIEAQDAVLIVTAHDCIDYADLVARSRLVVDTRNATASVTDGREKIVKA